MQTNLAHIYVEKFGSDKEADSRYSNQVSDLKSSGKAPVMFIPMAGAPAKACKWQEPGGGTSILCQYRWMILFLQDLPSQDAGTNFIRIMFNNMMKVRNEAMPVKK